MKLKIQVNEDNHFRKLLTVLKGISPFDILSDTELDFYSEVLQLNYQHRKIPFTDRNLLIFSSVNKVYIANKLDIPLSRVYNIISRLRSIGILSKEGLVPKYTLPKSHEIIIQFIDEGN